MKPKNALSLFIAVAMLLSMALPQESYATAERCTVCDGRGRTRIGNYYGRCLTCGGSGELTAEQDETDGGNTDGGDPPSNNTASSNGVVAYGDGWANVIGYGKKTGTVSPTKPATSTNKTPSVPNSYIPPYVPPAAPKAQIALSTGSNSDTRGLFLQKGVWGDVRDEDVLEVLQSVLDIFADTYGGDYIVRKAPHTIIRYSPVANGIAAMVSADLTWIQLSAAHTEWAQYVWMFGHELYHYTDGNGGGRTRHQWFDESICAMHTLYALEETAKKWERDAAWKNSAASVRNFYKKLLTSWDFGLSGSQLADLYKNNRAAMESDAHAENKNGKEYSRNLGLILYKVFKSDSNSWDALKVLHSIGNCSDLTFEQYMNLWYDRCDQTQRETVREIAGILEIELN